MSNNSNLNEISISVELTSGRKAELTCRSGYFCNITLPPSEEPTVFSLSDVREIELQMTALKKAFKVTAEAYNHRPHTKRPYHRRNRTVLPVTAGA